MIRSGAVTSAVDERGWTPLHVAAEGGRRAAAQTLLLFDADIDHRSVFYSNYLLFWHSDIRTNCLHF